LGSVRPYRSIHSSASSTRFRSPTCRCSAVIALSLGYQPVTAMRVAVAAAVLAGHLEREFDRRARRITRHDADYRQAVAPDPTPPVACLADHRCTLTIFPASAAHRLRPSAAATRRYIIPHPRPWPVRHGERDCGSDQGAGSVIYSSPVSSARGSVDRNSTRIRSAASGPTPRASSPGPSPRPTHPKAAAAILWNRLNHSRPSGAPRYGRAASEDRSAMA
jgi:hypothetical protein